jgi:hypothetical protein
MAASAFPINCGTCTAQAAPVRTFGQHGKSSNQTQYKRRSSRLEERRETTLAGGDTAGGPIKYGEYRKTVVSCRKNVTGHVTIPESVTTIGDHAFFCCTGLTSVSIPDGVTSIGREAFQGCGITSIAIPDSVKTIGDWAFAWCARLTGVTIPAGVTSIGQDAFLWCTSLTNITVDPGNANYSSQDGVLFNKDKTTLVQYPPGKTGPYTIPDSVTSIEMGALSCTGLTAITVNPENANYLSLDGVLFNKDKTTLVRYPPGKTGPYTIPDGVTNIEICAFSWCASLVSVTIPASVASIGIGAGVFSRCSALASITVNPENSNYSSRDGVLFNKDKTKIIKYPEGKTGGYKIPNGVTSIGWRAFSFCISLTGINIPASAANIFYSVVLDCSSLTSITVASGNENYSSQDGVLFNKDKTTLVRYPEGKSGPYTIPAGAASIGDCAFRGCTGLTGVTIPASVTSIGDCAFFDCNNLTSVTFEGSNTDIDGSPDNLQGKYRAGGAGTYTRPAGGQTWTKRV